MKKETLYINEIKLVGIKIRTKNQNEANPSTTKIGNLIDQYHATNLPNKILNCTNTGKTFAVYTDYESDHNGEYTYFIGEEVTNFDNIRQDLETITTQEGPYIKFTEDGQIPQVNIDAWHNIGKMTNNDFGGTRSYKIDFEIFNQNKAEIYIGINSDK